jgi:lipooligosaccharide transport system permease protein
MTVSPRHALAVWWRNFAMYRRSWALNILPNFFEPLLYLVSMGIGVGAYISEMGGTSYLAFLAPGLVAVAAMNGASFEVTYNAFVRLNFEKTYESMLTTPIQPEDVLAGEILWALTRATIYGGAFLIVVALFGLVDPLRALLALPLVPLAGLLFASIGIAFSLRIPTIELFSFYFTLFLTPLFLFSDVFFPPGALGRPLAISPRPCPAASRAAGAQPSPDRRAGRCCGCHTSWFSRVCCSYGPAKPYGAVDELTVNR